VVVEDEQVIDALAEVAYLVGGDDDAPVLEDVARKDPAELAFGRDVEAVCGFVEEEIGGPCGNGEGDEEFFALSVGEFVKGDGFDAVGDIEFGEQCSEEFVVESGVEWGVDVTVAGGGHAWEVELFRQDHDVAEGAGLAVVYGEGVSVLVFDGAAAGCGEEEPAQKFQEGGFAGAVYAE